jgi:hypothetical protein
MPKTRTIKKGTLNKLFNYLKRSTHKSNSKKNKQEIVEAELFALKEENAKLKTELALCEAKNIESVKEKIATTATAVENAKLKTELALREATIIESERLKTREETWEAAVEATAEKQLAKFVADFAKKSEVKTVKARNYSKATAIIEAEKAVDHYNRIYDRNNMDASAPQRMAAMLAGDKAMFIHAVSAMNLVEPQLKGEANDGVEWHRLRIYLLRSIKWCDDTIASAANGTYDATKTPPKFYDF